MNSTPILPLAFVLFCVTSSANLAFGQADSERWNPSIPKTWDDQVMKDLELPLANPSYTPLHMSAEYHDAVPIRPIYKTYPVYHPDREPPGYLEDLRQREPEIVFKREELKTKQDWLRAGEHLFHDPILDSLAGSRQYASSLYVRERRWYEQVNAPLTKDGILPFYRYVIERKGQVRLGVLGCASCHTRVLPDGTTIIGGQGNFPMDRAIAYDYQYGDLKSARSLERLLYAADWTGEGCRRPHLAPGNYRASSSDPVWCYGSPSIGPEVSCRSTRSV